MYISGHRGTRVHAIENTARAFEYCLQNRLDYIEFDVKKTADNVLVVYHDHTIDRLLNGKGTFEKYSWDQLQHFHYNDGQPLQTLQQFFEQVGKKIRPMLEIKSRGIGAQIIDLVHNFGYKHNEILIQSFNGNDIQECFNLDPQYDYGLCMSVLGKFPILQKSIASRWYRKAVAPYPVKWLNLDGPFIYTAFIEEAVKHGKHIILGAMKTERYLPQLEEWHVEIVNADDPVLIREKIHALGYQVVD
jgi:glycerophosphoryl diester phosphodiesterase